MNKKCIIMASLLLCFMMFPVSAAALPDLAVTGIATGAPSFISPSEANLPLTVTIINLGDATATRFKLSVEVIDSAGKFVKPFTLIGSPDRWYPWKMGMARGETHSFRGTLYIGSLRGPSLHGQRIIIIPLTPASQGIL